MCGRGHGQTAERSEGRRAKWFTHQSGPIRRLTITPQCLPFPWANFKHLLLSLLPAENSTSLQQTSTPFISFGDVPLALSHLHSLHFQTAVTVKSINMADEEVSNLWSLRFCLWWPAQESTPRRNLYTPIPSGHHDPPATTSLYLTLDADTIRLLA